MMTNRFIGASDSTVWHLKMIRLLFLCLILRAAAATADERDGSGGNSDAVGDDEDDDRPRLKTVVTNVMAPPDVDKAKGEADGKGEEGFTTIIVIAAVSVVALAIVAIVAIVLFKRHLHNREQGAYSVPTEQGQKVAV